MIGNYNKTEIDRVANAAVSDDYDILEGVTFLLDATPVIRFYLKAGADLSAHSFKIGGSAVAYASGTETATGEFNGLTYVDISLYAYRMIEDITVECGSFAASYHINAYYDGVDKTDVKLLDIVTKFYNYCVSADAYKAEVAE